MLLLRGSISAQEEICESNAAEIDLLVTRLKTQVSKQGEALESNRKSENIDLLASSNQAWQSGARIRYNDKKYETLVREIRLEGVLAIIQLQSRETTVCNNKNASGKSENQARGESLVDSLNNLNKLHSQGILTDEGFNAAKRRLLGL